MQLSLVLLLQDYYSQCQLLMATWENEQWEEKHGGMFNRAGEGWAGAALASTAPSKSHKSQPRSPKKPFKSGTHKARLGFMRFLLLREEGIKARSENP